MALPSRLLETLAFIYYWQPEEIADLEAELLERRKATWLDTLEEQAALHGCRNARAVEPRREDLAELRAMCAEDAKSISQTWRRDVDRQLTKLYNANVRGNRYYYIANMKRWAQSRARWKLRQVGLYTDQSTRFYAINRFRLMNGLRGARYIYAGPAPVSENCVRRTAAGIVDEAYVQRNPVPNHPNCPHEWQVVNPQRIPCDEIWVG